MSTLASLDDKVYQVNDAKRVSMRDLLASFKRHGASRVTDLHLKINSPPIYRADGLLRKTNGRPLDAETIESLARAVFTAEEWESLHKHRSVNNSHLIEGTRFRMNCFHDRRGLALAVRALDTATPRIEDIGFPNGVWEDIVELRQGLVLLTGATGAGKSTTIAALIGRIAQTRACHIITLEDPIEYELESDIAFISQRAIGRDVPGYARGLRDCLREDPDVIFVGEMTDAESTAWTLTAAETGHLVFSSLHTRDAAGALTRILDLYPPGRTDEIANQLSMGLRYILAQKLAPRADGRGRVMAMEVLHNTFAIANLLRQNKPDQIYSVMQTHTRDVPAQRMRSLERSLAELVRKGAITLLEAERAANLPQMLADEMSRLDES